MHYSDFVTWFGELAASHYAVRAFAKGVDLDELGNADLPAVFLEVDMQSTEASPGVDQFAIAFNVVNKPERTGGIEWGLLGDLRAIGDDLIEAIRAVPALRANSVQTLAIAGTGGASGLTGWRYELTVNLERHPRGGLSDRFDPAYVPPAPGDPNPVPLPGLTAGNGLARVGNEIVARLGAGLALDSAGRLTATGGGTGPGGDYATVAALEAEADARAAADADLTNSLDVEATARELADTNLANDLEAEVTTRAAADAGIEALAINAQVSADAAQGTAYTANATADSALTVAAGAQAAATAAQSTANAANTAISAHTSAGDPHGVYHTDTRGDARYYRKTETDMAISTAVTNAQKVKAYATGTASSVGNTLLETILFDQVLSTSDYAALTSMLLKLGASRNGVARSSSIKVYFGTDLATYSNNHLIAQLDTTNAAFTSLDTKDLSWVFRDSTNLVGVPAAPAATTYSAPGWGTPTTPRYSAMINTAAAMRLTVTGTKALGTDTLILEYLRLLLIKV